MSTATSGPLHGIRVVELGGIGPAPHGCMLLADLGAEVVRIERATPGAQVLDRAIDPDATMRGRLTITADLKNPRDVADVAALIEQADVVVEGFRPGVAERLGLGPERFTESHPGLVYARMTGWGQSGPLSQAPGHDLNYIALTGILDKVGREGERSVPPLNLVGDFGGGSAFLVIGVLAALIERAGSGRGQVVDAAMVDGASVLAQIFWSLRGLGAMPAGRGGSLVDGSHPFYDVYVCGDGLQVAVGAAEAPFFAALVAGLGLDPDSVPAQWDRSTWPQLRSMIATAFASRPRADWVTAFAGTQGCVTPVLTFDEAVAHEHATARESFVTVAGVQQPRPAPRFSRTDPPTPVAERREPDGLAAALAAWATA